MSLQQFAKIKDRNNLLRDDFERFDLNDLKTILIGVEMLAVKVAPIWSTTSPFMPKSKEAVISRIIAAINTKAKNV